MTCAAEDRMGGKLTQLQSVAGKLGLPEAEVAVVAGGFGDGQAAVLLGPGAGEAGPKGTGAIRSEAQVGEEVLLAGVELVIAGALVAQQPPSETDRPANRTDQYPRNQPRAGNPQLTSPLSPGPQATSRQHTPHRRTQPAN